MKNYVILAICGLITACSLAAGAAELNCRVVSVRESANIWEEGLGVYGSRDADDDSEMVRIKTVRRKPISIWIGQARYVPDASASMTHKFDERTSQFFVRTRHESLQIKIYAESERGVVLVKDRGEARFQLAATIDCSSLRLLEQTSLASANLQPMSESELKALPKPIKAAMSETDIAFELGDGYYSLYELHTYRLMDPDTGELAGFVEYGLLHYSEGDDVEAVVKYDRNGLRHGPIESQTLNERP